MVAHAWCVAWIGLIALLYPGAAFGQDCGLRNSARLEHSVCDSGGTGETFLDTGVVPGGPLVTSMGSVRDGACGGHVEISFLAVSDYGSLAYHASGTGHSDHCCGLFMWIDEGAGGTPRAQYSDRLTVESTTLAPGSPVQLRATLSVMGGTSASNANTQRNFGGHLIIMGPVNVDLELTSQGTTSSTFTLNVGQSVDVRGHLNCILRDYVLLGLNQTGTFGANINVVTTIEPLTSGATLTSCSGHNHALPACAADLDNGTGNGVRDGGVDIGDLLYFLTAFEAGSTAADLDNGSGFGIPDQGVDINDLLFLLAHFEAGC